IFSNAAPPELLFQEVARGPLLETRVIAAERLQKQRKSECIPLIEELLRTLKDPPALKRENLHDIQDALSLESARLLYEERLLSLLARWPIKEAYKVMAIHALEAPPDIKCALMKKLLHVRTDDDKNPTLFTALKPMLQIFLKDDSVCYQQTLKSPDNGLDFEKPMAVPGPKRDRRLCDLTAYHLARRIVINMTFELDAPKSQRNAQITQLQKMLSEPR
ncbi:MAG: hypothetical protein AAF492_22755, partial [Verrucomicrobiota bacterium]